MALILRSVAFCFLLLSLSGGVRLAAVEAVDDVVHALSAQKIECHGIYNGDEFWMRLLPADKKYNGLRILELTYTPKKPTDLDGTLLVDHPQILIDDTLGIHAWKEGRGVHQSGLGGIVFRKASYTVVRELNDAEGEAIADQFEIKTNAVAWDLQLAPMLLACSSLNGTIKMPVIDFFGKQRNAIQVLHYQGTAYTIADQVFTVKRDADGRLQEVKNAAGESVLLIKGWR